jgi:hypothetical protein
MDGDDPDGPVLFEYGYQSHKPNQPSFEDAETVARFHRAITALLG